MSPSIAPRVTVFTPTFNRADKIGRVFDSLMAQACAHGQFEWVVIDDGSTDDTVAVMADFKAQADFDIVYRFQTNGGKHVAHNHAVSVARGDLFLDCDSDDAFDARAIGYFLETWDALSPAERVRYSGISVRCRNEFGAVVTPALPRSPFVSNNSEIVIVHRQTGDGWGIMRTDVLAQYPFPADWPGSHFPELVHWNRIGRAYDGLYTDEVLYTIYYDATNSITRNFLSSDLQKAACKGLLESADYLNNDLKYLVRRPIFFVKRALIYNFYKNLYRENLDPNQTVRGWAKWWCWLFRPFGFLATVRFGAGRKPRHGQQ